MSNRVEVLGRDEAQQLVQRGVVRGHSQIVNLTVAGEDALLQGGGGGLGEAGVYREQRRSFR